jgi:hypothetical protein
MLYKINTRWGNIVGLKLMNDLYVLVDERGGWFIHFLFKIVGETMNSFLYFNWLLSLVIGLLCVTNQNIYVQKNLPTCLIYVLWMLCEIFIHLIYLVLESTLFLK